MATRESRIRPPELTQQFVRAKCDYFVDVQLWPLRSKLNPEGWLQNFDDRARDYAIHLLSAFLYFSEALTGQLFETTFQRLSLLLGLSRRSFADAQSQWRAFCDNVVVTHVTGEMPNTSDSGYAFVRMARQQLGVSQDQIKSPAETAQILVARGPRPVVFLDDFVGSGQQCKETWLRQMKLPDGGSESFANLATVGGASFFYCPLVCTKRGYERIREECPRLNLCCAHVIGEQYSALSPSSAVWPTHLRGGAMDFLRRSSQRAGIPERSWRGFDNLGLTLAFAHSVPDATLPIFYWEGNGWQPLIRRT